MAFVSGAATALSSSSSSFCSPSSSAAANLRVATAPAACRTAERPSRLVSPSAATQPSGTRYIGGKRVKVLQVGDKSASFRDKAPGEQASIKLLSRVQQLRLLTKAEKAGLLSAAEKAGLSLSSIEKYGLLSKAEELGLLSAATDPGTPGAILSLSLLLLAVGPLIVYFVPEDATWQVVVQVVAALVSVLGGSAAFGASSFVSSLQKSD